jgi:DNA-binding XRE family transcriptional regulator
MGSLKRISRDRHLTPEEVAQDKAVREQVLEEFPPIRPPLVRRAAKLLLEERERQQLTQAEAAERTGLSREVICRLETQPGNATINTLERYARGLGFEFEIALAPAKAKRKARKRTA